VEGIVDDSERITIIEKKDQNIFRCENSHSFSALSLFFENSAVAAKEYLSLSLSFSLLSLY
jgi:hypothetical protein